MFQNLVSHNSDLRQLVDKGYAVAFDSNYLIIRDIPYLDSELNKKIGAIVSKFQLLNNEKVALEDHQIFWAGSEPYGLDGKLIANLGGGPTKLALSDNCNDIQVERSFSNKPLSGSFPNFFEKIESYVTIISGPAMTKYEGPEPYTFRAVKDIISDEIFKFHDTLTSRAEITDLAAKFKEDVVAVIGLGGTGAYVLDYLVKTPIKEIRAFDHDFYYVHNAFRTPGKTDDLEFEKPKAEIYKNRYDNFRHGLSFNHKFIDSTSGEDFNGVTFAFVCVDKGSSRAKIFDLLISKNIPFIDVGMGLKRRDNGSLNGLICITYYSVENAQKLRDKGIAELSDAEENLYRTNIQISELNALNACLAVIKFKQIRGFYFEEIPYFDLAFEVGDLMKVAESKIDED